MERDKKLLGRYCFLTKCMPCSLYNNLYIFIEEERHTENFDDDICKLFYFVNFQISTDANNFFFFFQILLYFMHQLNGILPSKFSVCTILIKKKKKMIQEK